MEQLSILIVEDERIVALELEKSLIGLGYLVCGRVSTGKQAVSQYRKLRPDLVLMDIRLGEGSDGIETAQRIRDISSVPVVYMTGHADEATLQRCKETGPYGFIVKPFNIHEIRSAIETAFLRYNLENRIHTSQEHLHTVLKSIGDGVIVTDEKGAVTFVNPAAEELIHSPWKPSGSKKIEEIFPLIDEKTKQNRYSCLRRTLKTGEALGPEDNKLLVHSSGSPIAVEGRSSPLFEDGKLKGAVLVFRDIRAQRNRRNLLRAGETKYRALFQHIHDPVVVAEASSGRLLQWNKAVEKVYGYPSGTLSSMTVKDFLADPESGTWKDPALRSKRISPFQTRHSTRDGRVLDVEVYAKKVCHPDETVWLYTFRNITALTDSKRTLEQQVRMAGIINRVARRISSRLDLDVLMKEIVKSIQEGFGFFSVLILLKDDSGRRLHLKAIAGGYSSVFSDDLTVDMGEGMVGHAATTGETQSSGRVETHPHYVRKADEKTRSEVSVPLKTRTHGIIGVLDIQDDVYDAFSEAQIQALETLSAQLAGAVENALLYRQSLEEIRERQKAEEKARENEELLGNILESIDDGILVLNTDYQYMYWNRRMEEISGMDRTRVLGSGRTAWDLFPHLKTVHTDDLMKKAMGGQIVTRSNIPYKLENGREGYTYEAYMPLKEESGEIRGIIGVVRDITEKKKTRETLRRSELLYRSVTQSLSAGVAISSSRKILTFVNPTLAEMLGYSVSELLGKSLRDMVVPGSGSDCSKNTGNHNESEPDRFECRLKRKDGTGLDVLVSSSPMQISGEQNPGTLMVIVDITERKTVEQELEFRRQSLESIFQNAPSAIVVFDPDGRITEWNPRAEQVFGYSRDEVITKPIDDIVTLPENKKKCSALTRGALQGVETRGIETVRYDKDRKPIDVMASASAIRTGAKVHGVVVVYHDISRLKRVEKELRESEARIREQNRYNKLRADVWKLAFDRSLTESGLIQNLLDRIGPELGVSRACYSPVMGREVVCTQEWCAEKVKPSLGTHLPLSVARCFVNNKRNEFSLENASDMLPSKMKPALTPVVKRFAKSLNLQSIYVEPFSLGGQWAGMITFDICEGNTEWAGWSESQRKIVAEVTQIITQNIEQRRVRMDLEESEERFRSISVSAQDAIVMMDQDESITYWNPTAERIFSRSKKEVQGKNFYQLLIPREYRHRIREWIDDENRKTLKSEGISLIEAMGRRKQDELFPMEVSLSTVNIQGRRHVIGMIRDITDRKRSEEEIIRLVSAMRQAREGVVITDLQGRIVYVNPFFNEMTGYSLEEVKGKNPRILSSGRQDQAFYQELWSTITRGKTWSGMFINKRKDGSLYPEESTIFPVKDPYGKIINFAAVKRDITERREAEEAMQRYTEDLKKAKEREEKNAKVLSGLVKELEEAKNQAEEAARTKSEFLANMSHEIRTPMNGIIGMTELALDTELTTVQRDYLQSVMNSADSLLTVINDILDFSKIEAGRMDMESIPFSLSDTLDEVLQLQSLKASEKDLEVISFVKPEVPDRVIGDPVRFRQIITNLVSNAVKFTDEGEVSVQLELASKNNRHVVLRGSVRDTGAGIDKAKQEMIFQAFTQADGSTTRRYGGTGLGLTITAKLIDMMRGKIWVESPAPGGDGSTGGPGSCFYFEIPMNIAETGQTQKSRSGPLLKLAGRKVLIVDDNATNRRVLEEILDGWGMKTSSAVNGKEALKILESASRNDHSFSLMLLDANMPVMDGFELAGAVQKSPSLADVTIMMLTSSRRKGDALRCQKLGISMYLVKPIRQKELLQAILSALGNEEAIEMERTDGSSRKYDVPIQGGSDGLKPCQILLAEDNEINRNLAEALLKKRGWTVRAAADGEEAVILWRKYSFDLILMDVQMPGMDGYEATQMIRREEESLGVHTPIVAMTAHVMKGDRERCLESGMDDYISKPMKARSLYETVERVISAGDQEPPALIDWNQAAEGVDGDWDLYQSLAETFLNEYSELKPLKEAVQNRDAEGLEKSAHSLKGAMANLGAESARRLAAELERKGRSGDLSNAVETLSSLKDEISRLKRLFLTPAWRTQAAVSGELVNGEPS
ncbi:MAG TPA: PAS domain S-box protein [bacterium]|nr:PAS domain S-box protein [bacterium]